MGISALQWQSKLQMVRSKGSLRKQSQWLCSFHDFGILVLAEIPRQTNLVTLASFNLAFAVFSTNDLYAWTNLLSFH